MIPLFPRAKSSILRIKESTVENRIFVDSVSFFRHVDRDFCFKIKAIRVDVDLLKHLFVKSLVAGFHRSHRLVRHRWEQEAGNSCEFCSPGLRFG